MVTGGPQTGIVWCIVVVQMHWCSCSKRPLAKVLQTTSQRCQLMEIFLCRLTLKFDGWPWKTIRHLFYTTSSFVHHFKAIGESKLKLQSGNAQFSSKSAIYCPVRPWNLTDALKNNMAPFLYYVKLCASFQSHRWIQTGVTVRKCSIWVKLGDILSRVTSTDDLGKI